jgi:hypothetical protein
MYRVGCLSKSNGRAALGGLSLDTRRKQIHTVWISDSQTAGFSRALAQITVTRVVLFVQRVVMKTTLHSP